MNRTAPASIRAAATCLVAYGALVLGQALVFGSVSDWADRAGLIRAFVRCAGVTCVAVYLLKLHRWAWWIALVGTIILVLLSAVALPFLVSVWRRDALPLGGASVVFACATAIVLLVTLVLLVAPSSRRAILEQGS